MAILGLGRSQRKQQASEAACSDGELREANRQLHEFLDLLGHELRSPLGAIRNALCVLEIQGDDTAQRDWARGMIDRQTQHIGRLIEDILEVSRIEHGKISLRKQSLDVAQTVARAVEMVRGAVEGRGHQLEISLPADPVPLHADPARVEQVLTNLLNNAAKYMEPGGHIWVTVQVQDDDVVLRVRDSGIGIDPQMLPHVFDPFWQADRTLNLAQGGLGLGLSLVRKLAEMHGGSASAFSPGLGRGSEFVVRLPRQMEVPMSVAGRASDTYPGAFLT